MSRETQVARVFVDLANSWLEEFDVVALLTTVTLRCVDVVGATAAGLLLANADNEMQLAAASSDQPQLLELIEMHAHERFAPAALAMGFGSAHALSVTSRGAIVGVLTLFHTDDDAFSDDDLVIAQAFADVASISVLQHRTAEENQLLSNQLQHALDTRVVIEQAKGVIVGQTGWTMEVAFEALRRFARHAQRKLADVAADVVAGRVSADELR